jgi:hypothetical protein
MKKTFLSLVVIASLVSCKKDDVAPVETCKATTASIAGTYKITAISYKFSPGTAAEDEFAQLPDCQKDDIYNLNTDGSVTINDEGASCGLPPAPGSLSGWWLESNNTRLKMTDLDLSIDSFDCKKLVVTQTGVNDTNDTRTTTYEKQ